MIRIAIIISEEQEREEISKLLTGQKDFYLASIGKNGYDAIKASDNERPDIIIMDLKMDDSNGVALSPVIIRKSPKTKLIMIGSRDEEPWIKHALVAGISGLICKQSDTGELPEAIDSVLHGGIYLSSQIKKQVHNFLCGTVSGSNRGSAQPVHQLRISDTEQNILNRIAKGYSDKEIADELCIAAGTIRNYLGALKRKTGQKSRSQLIFYSLVHGLIDSSLDSGNHR
ncbi:MAG: response regulator transcription factor [Treponema sp.]|nr:response regulator transcription factor [Treponema sp.]